MATLEVLRRSGSPGLGIKWALTREHKKRGELNEGLYQHHDGVTQGHGCQYPGIAKTDEKIDCQS